MLYEKCNEGLKRQDENGAYCCLMCCRGGCLVDVSIQADIVCRLVCVGCLLENLALCRVGICVWAMCALQCAKNSVG